MNLIAEESMSNARPYPGPLPRGENSPKAHSHCKPLHGTVGQAFQPAGTPDFPVRCFEGTGDWKVVGTGRQECLPYHPRVHGQGEGHTIFEPPYVGCYASE